MSVLYVDMKKFPSPVDEFVAWVDIMGTKNIFKKTDNSPTLYILKLHKCAQLVLAGHEGFKIYPVIDGFYITSDDLEVFLLVLKEIFIKIADEFVNSNSDKYRFIIRAGVSYGKVIHGGDFQDTKDISGLLQIKKFLVFGGAVIQAVEAESNAAPFSINVHPYFRNLFSRIITLSNRGEILWFNECFFRDRLKNSVVSYYDWLNKNPHWVDYPLDKKEEHLKKFLDMMKF